MSGEELPPLPKMIVAGPYLVPISLVSPRTIARALKCDLNAAAGYWCPDKSRVYIDKTLTLKRQWEVYWHELTHAVHDLHTIFFGGL